MLSTLDFALLLQKTRHYALELGFSALSVVDMRLENPLSKAALTNSSVSSTAHFEKWLENDFHGKMDFMQKYAHLRNNPAELLPDLRSILCVRLPYFVDVKEAEILLNNPTKAMISRYALGRDYHKIMRKRLQKLADFIEQNLAQMGFLNAWNYRVFADSAPILEAALAQKSGLAWQGKHSITLTKKGSFYFLGEMYTSLPFAEMAEEKKEKSHCGTCTRCMDICPTKAIIAPYIVDARRCISYLTIELKEAIPLEFRAKIGNRIYGCDDCQLICPWNKWAIKKDEKIGDAAFLAKNGLNDIALIDLFKLSEGEFTALFLGSPILRIGHERFMRNVAVALGNFGGKEAIDALEKAKKHPSLLVKEHILWALAEIKKTALKND